MTNLLRGGPARLATGAVALATGLLLVSAGPALSAAAAQPDLHIAVPGPAITLDSPGKSVRIDIGNNGAAPATDVRISYTITGGSGLTVEPPNDDSCTVSGGTTTCLLGSLAPGENPPDQIVFVQRTESAAAGTAQLTVTLKAAEDDADPSDNTVTVPVTVVDAGLDLVAWAAGLKDVAPGSTVLLNWAVSNESGTPSSSTTITIDLPHFVTFAPEFTGCEINAERSSATCQAGGLGYSDGYHTFDVPVVVAASAPGPEVLNGGAITVSGQAAQPSAGRRAPGKSFQRVSRIPGAVSSETDKVGGDNTVGFAITTTTNSIDLAVRSDPASGRLGETVPVTFHLTNNGPASGGAGITVKAPDGTVVLNTPDGDLPECRNGADPDFVEATEITCSFESEFQPGVTFAFTLKFKIKSTSIGTNGRITVFDELETPESNPDNNSAAIVISLVTGGTTPPGPGGDLPVTGAQVGLIGGIGGGVIVLGALMWLVAWRRRTVLVAPDEPTS